jgi:hypothetical protein
VSVCRPSSAILINPRETLSLDCARSPQSDPLSRTIYDHHELLALPLIGLTIPLKERSEHSNKAIYGGIKAI